MMRFVKPIDGDVLIEWHYRDRLFPGVKWCEEHGYRSSWISDFAFEKLPGR